MLATIPSIMMWDDHDIFDGWGSYPEDLQTCDVYPEIYKAAVRHFRLFQLRSTRNVTLLAGGGTPSHYSGRRHTTRSGSPFAEATRSWRWTTEHNVASLRL